MRGVNRYKELQALINSYLTLTDQNKDDLAKLLGISRATFYRKYNNPENFTYDEIVFLVKLMDIEDHIKIKLIG